MKVTPDSSAFRAPRTLRVTGTQIRRGLYVGSPFADRLKHWVEDLSDAPHDYVEPRAGADLAMIAPRPLSVYDYVCIALDLRGLAPESAFARIDFDDEASFKTLFDVSRQEMIRQFEPLLRRPSRADMLTLVCDYCVPHQNPNGRLLRRHTYSNIGYFISRLNEEMEDFVLDFRNTYLLSVNEISATLGRRYIQDDIVAMYSHGGVWGDADHRFDQERLEPTAPMSEHYEMRQRLFFTAVWNEIEASIRAARRQDAVRLVLVDLDDTLWRGTLGEGNLSAQPVEGWPIGLAEALSYLRRRGLLLGIVAKTDEAQVKSKWPQIYGGVLKFEDFAVHRMNWRPKAENVEEILAELNMRPADVVFIDDNPTEREAVVAAFPDIRVLGSDLYSLKQVLIASPETQVASGTPDRREIQVTGKEMRAQRSRPTFLANLNISALAAPIFRVEDPNFARALPFLNEIHTFNTTGARWSNGAMAQFLGSGGRIWAIEAADRFTRYGLSAIGLVSDDELVQFVISSHVIGLDFEDAALWLFEREAARAGFGSILARYEETPANRPIRQLFLDHGYTFSGGHFVKSATKITPWPAHIRLRWSGPRLPLTSRL